MWLGHRETRTFVLIRESDGTTHAKSTLNTRRVGERMEGLEIINDLPSGTEVALTQHLSSVDVELIRDNARKCS